MSNARFKIIFYTLLVLVALGILIFTWLEMSGRIDIMADYTSYSHWDLTDGDALSAKDIQEFIKARNPNVEKNTGARLSHYCKKFKVNPAFCLGIAEADSAQGTVGAGRANKNPGNTKISYSRLDEVGIKHTPYRGVNNFAVFKNWGGGYSAIAVTLANYDYYNMRGLMGPILRTYVNHPNPDYYNTVNGVMYQLLSDIDIKLTVVAGSQSQALENAQVLVKRKGKVVKKKRTNKKGGVSFKNLPRSSYILVLKKEDYREKRKKLKSVQKTTRRTIRMQKKDRVSITGRVQKLIMNLPDNEGINLKLSGIDGEVVDRSKTAKDGFYYFGGLLPGKYVVSIESQTDVPTGFYYSQKVNLTKKPSAVVDFVY